MDHYTAVQLAPLPSQLDKNQASLRTYSDMTLVGNWYEARWGRPEEIPPAARMKKTREHEEALNVPVPMSCSHYPAAKPPHIARIAEPNTFRCQTVDFAEDPATPYLPKDTMRTALTTKQEMESQLHQTLAAPRRPKLINHLNMRQTLMHDRSTARPADGFGATVRRHGKEELQGKWATTYQEYYIDRPTEAKAADSDTYKVQGGHTTAGKLFKDAHTFGKNEDEFAGRAGRRGELVRRPAEAGSVYGVSTFVDDYAKWGTKLMGMRLAETADKKTTRYFDA